MTIHNSEKKTTNVIPQLTKETAGWRAKVCFQVLIGNLLFANMVLLLWVPVSFCSPPWCPSSGFHCLFLSTTMVPLLWEPRSLSVHQHSAPPVGTTVPFCSPPWCPSSGFHCLFLSTTMVPLLWVPRSVSFHQHNAPPVGITVLFCSPP
jgi:hypothetical protein